MVSVIVPVYNGEQYLRECLHSILNQTYRDLEILVIDDGSGDGTSAICREMAALDGRIRLFRQENAGVSAARNKGLQKARGDYVSFLDADDLLPAGAVEALAAAAEAGADFVIGSHQLFRGKRVRLILQQPTEYEAPVLTKMSHPETLVSLMCAKLYSRSLLREKNIVFDTHLPYGEDTVFNLQYCSHVRRMVVTDTVVCRCRLGGMASSRRYYPNRTDYAAKLIEAYIAAYGGRETIPASILDRIVGNELSDTVFHYLTNCKWRESGYLTEKALETLAPYTSPWASPGNGTSVRNRVFRDNWQRILLRKFRNLLQERKIRI